jgi:predicted outer membrane repeat protein
MLTLKHSVIALIVIFSFTSAVWADTTVPGGNVSGLWTLADSPYLLQGDVTVPAGQTLTIEPGVTVFSESWYAITVNGHLHAVGTENDPITFTSTPAGPGEPGWKGIRFYNTNEGHLIYTIVENGKVTAGDPFDRGGAVYISNSSPVISHSTFRNNQAGSRGGAIYINEGSPIIMNNLI